MSLKRLLRKLRRSSSFFKIKLIASIVVVSLIGYFIMASRFFQRNSTLSKKLPATGEEERWRRRNNILKTKRVNSTHWEHQPWREMTGMEIIETIEHFNSHHEVLNEQHFGRVGSEGNELNNLGVDAVLAFRVNGGRLPYLRYTIESFSRVKDIDRALLLFSHDSISQPCNQLIRDIKFTRVIQLLYPYSLEFFPNSFPGRDPDDCPAHMSRENFYAALPTIHFSASKLKCKSWQHHDIKGRYRQASKTELKHHWWWLANYAFDGIVKRYGLHEKYVVHVNEDEMATPDLLHVLRILSPEKVTSVCPNCFILFLGLNADLMDNAQEQRYRKDIAKVALHKQGQHHRGAVFTLRGWERIRVNCTQDFCTHDEVSWDWAFLVLGRRCMQNKHYVLRVVSPRLIHIGECGMNMGAENCSADMQSTTYARRAQKIIDANIAGFFPADFQTVSRLGEKPSLYFSNGGWGDPRDHELCLLNSHPVESILATSINNSSAVVASPQKSRKQRAHLIFGF